MIRLSIGGRRFLALWMLAAPCMAQQVAAAQGACESSMDAAEMGLNDPATAEEARAAEKHKAIECALMYRREGQFERALSLLLRATQTVTGDAELLLDTALLEDQMRLYIDAGQAVLAARKLLPNDAKTIYAEARIKMDLQQITEAEEAMTQYLKLRPNDASAHYGLGRMYRSELRNDEASAEFMRSLSLDPHQAESNYQMGELAAERGDTRRAAEFYERALAVDPMHAGALTGEAIVAYGRKDYVRADELLATAEKSAPDFQTSHYYRGLVLARLGRKQESEAEFALSLKLEANQKKNKGFRLAPAP